ncbi:ABC transporter ATP-binding protein/permease [Jatrophihabitans telluris]|uniref:ABC transporter ATP-binding protein/permease n=1 Tax=Jatrophihabitans telluris TaxID=2038343 RepID=A0ABY4R6H5_9ACTN|nr:ABC transporter ATP-binding protein [Jatrophihabitans telluris]UQX90144.1 ABC transporter ATP-binding protein/permease [Jatrophihabitans telluris]
MPREPDSSRPNRPQWLRRLLGYCLRHRRDLIGAFGASLVGALISVAVPLVVKHVIDSVSGPTTGQTHHRSAIGWWIAILVVAALAQYGLTFYRRFSAGRLSLSVQYDLRADIFRSLQRLDGAAQDSLHTGQIVSRSITDVGLVQGLLAFLPMLTGNVLLFGISLIAMLFLSPMLTLVAVAIAPALWFVALASRRDLFPANWDAQQQAGDLVGQVEGTVTGVRVVKGFGQEQREVQTLQARALRLFGSRMRVVRLQARYSAALSAIPALGQVGVLLLGGWLALHGHITLGTFLAFSTYLGQLVGPVRQVTALLTIGQQARAGVERVLEVIDASPDIVDPELPTPLPQGPLSIEFTSVRFGYTTSEPVLTGLDLAIGAGETVAIVGGAGSGKSTLAMLVPRFYDVHSGRIRVGGADVRDLELSQLRSSLGMVFEDSFLFSDTIAANIAYGRPEATPEQVRAAAAAAEAEGFIAALPDGFQTLVGERGLTLSGGQRQRIALARALLTEPRILLLDDATSAVDPRVEAEILATLRRLITGRTTLLIAHRRSTLALADRIVVLDGGSVSDIGTFDELMGRSALFRLLLAGPGDDAEGRDAGRVRDDAEPLEPDDSGVTPLLWRAPEPGVVATPSTNQAAAAAVAAGAPGHGGGMFGAVPASADLIAKVAALPPATDRPDLDESAVQAPDPAFDLRRLLTPVRLAFILGIALIGLDAILQLALPALIRTGIDDGVSRHSAGLLLTVSAIALGVLLLDWSVSASGQRLTGRTGERLLYSLRVKTFAHLQRLGLDYYERELGGRIVTRMTTDVDALSNFLQTGLATALVSLLTLLGVLVALILLDAQLSLVLLVMLPVLIGATLLFRRKSVPAYVEARERVSTVNAQFQENVAGVRVAQVFSREDYNTEQFLGAARRYQQSRMRAQTYIAAYFPFVQLLADLSGALVLAFGAQRLDHHTLTAGSLIAFFLYLDAFFGPVQQLSQVFDGYQQASVGLSRLQELLRTQTSTPLRADAEPVDELTGEVRFDRVEFAYAGADRPAVTGLDLQIPAGQSIALVGQTGAGKSTVVKLIARFYDPTSGSVIADGRDLRSLRLSDFRRRLGYVPQESYLFDGTVADAIAYGRPQATPAEIESAARAVGAHEMIASLRDGYLQQVGERGRNLSAGQRQLVALARAELVDPDILLLDEATAALDLASEAAVVAATERLTRHRTTVTVAHRLSTAARADRILMLSDGRIVEDGSHAQLLAADGAYAALWRSYMQGTDGSASDVIDEVAEVTGSVT